MNWRNVLPFGVPETPLEVIASLASAFAAGVLGAAIVLTLIIWKTS